MKSTFRIVLVLLLCGTFCHGALAEEAQNSGEDTIVVVAVGATPEDIVNIIELPIYASSKAGDRATANGNNPNDATSNNIGEQIRNDLHLNARRDARGDKRRDPPGR